MKYSILGLILLITGCESTKQSDWRKDGVTDDEFHRDSAECKLEADRSASPLQFVNAGIFILDQSRQSNIYKECMESKGYYLIATNTTPAHVKR